VFLLQTKDKCVGYHFCKEHNGISILLLNELLLNLKKKIVVLKKHKKTTFSIFFKIFIECYNIILI
jgi:hypothetical protein